jgi:hypothetical protein
MRVKSVSLQTDGKERRRKSLEMVLDLPFIDNQRSPTCSNFQPSRGMALTPSSVLVSMTPLEEEEDRLIIYSLLC